MRTFLKILFQAAAGLAVIYGFPGVAAAISQLLQSPHSRLWQAALAIILVAGILWWNLGKPRIRIRGIPWRGLLYFPGTARINPTSSAFNNTAYVDFMNATHAEDEDAV